MDLTKDEVDEVPKNPNLWYMPDDEIGGRSLPKPRDDLFDTIPGCVASVRLYAKEAGFSVAI